MAPSPSTPPPSSSPGPGDGGTPEAIARGKSPSQTDDFPREEVAALVGGAKEKEKHAQAIRWSWQGWLVALGLVLIALGLPCARYFRSMDWLWQLSGSGPAPHGLLTVPIYGLRALAPVTLEQSAFLVSAVMYGVCYLALLRLLRAVGFDQGLATAAALVSLVCPIAWLGATLPVSYTAGLFGATVFATKLFQTRQTRPFGYLWQASIWLLIAYLMAPENIWLVLPGMWAVWRQHADRDQGSLSAFCLFCVFAVSVAVTLAMREDPLAFLRHSAFGNGFGSEGPLAHGLFWLFGLGALWFGLFSLIWGKREPEESGAPSWTWVWVAVGLVPWFAGGVVEGPRGAFLVPIAAVGLADALNRRVAREHLVKAGMALVCAHALLIVVFSISLERGNTHKPWMQAAKTGLEKSDAFLSRDSGRSYLAAFRLGIRTCQSDGLGGVHHEWRGPEAKSKRLVIDAWDGPLPGTDHVWPVWLTETAGLTETALAAPASLAPGTSEPSE